MVRRLAAGGPHDLFRERLAVAFGVHGDEALQLQKTGIDQPPRALVLEADPLDRQMLQLAHRDAATEIGHLGRGGIGIDRPADQDQRARLCVGVLGGQIGRGRKGQRHWLADRDDIRLGAHDLHELGEVERVILDIELAGADRDIPRIVPVGDIDIRVRQQRGDGGPQQRCIVPRHRSDQQHLACHRRPAAHEELHQVAEGLLDDVLDVDQMVLPVRPDNRPDAPVGFRDHAAEGPFRHFAPGGHHGQHRVHRHRERRVTGKSPGRGAQPLIRVTGAFHQVIGEHILHHVSLPRAGGCRMAGQGSHRYAAQRRR